MAKVQQPCKTLLLLLPTLHIASIPPPTPEVLCASALLLSAAFSTSFLLYVGPQRRCGSRLHGAQSGVACLSHKLVQLVNSEVRIPKAVALVYRSSASLGDTGLRQGRRFTFLEESQMCPLPYKPPIS